MSQKSNISTAAGHTLGQSVVTDDPWQALRGYTRARIALGRSGSSLPTREILDFGLSHAMARDAVHLPMQWEPLHTALADLGLTSLHVHSRAPDRASYLLRPDWGRRINDASVASLQQAKPAQPIDVQIVIADGLSSLAVARHAAPLIAALLPLLPQSWRLGPVVTAGQGRVALGDEVGELLCAKLLVMLIGERPGLSSPDSLGIYLTFDPKLGLSDANRNCISNVRPEGLSYERAAFKLVWLAKEALRQQISGVALKDESDAQMLDVSAAPGLDSP